jgi:hypothetical protein
MRPGRYGEVQDVERRDCDRMFIAVLEVGSFAGAAQRLGTSASQASKIVSRSKPISASSSLPLATASSPQISLSWCNSHQNAALASHL